ncbi:MULTISPECIES: homoprotocatechuate degradation operon regulator HpaR [unclassified Rhizobium]|jgi:homoprotocatechuate degradation regulator HpaR|uniref:homoprotocatechuate degradation operon regulator HpaR n=1 Tax=unclassified Rhizobium TaxID=2613769 RepID=UPI001A97DA1A|nr:MULTISPECIES: homoprotocatechuate degradation operon regulator HpaR [unclassified Rhizobium]MBX5156342.1 homoprotocatechuate degradation operon regulator HpaR [Rhizobium sp. NZLR8]MBX5162471.1 homoprotocatechuate degradation operon regulator HpaR [Rhizobium sp. NZLR4b]MBX5173969.1 homoprotocatechuate degradation operon regulator HpaR [Rhizobium sp. NZLR1b]MBX5185534.1 homoprotocatechuate degradation operon regulator HpaR [Rhizobium sp. NZLR5]MBX5187325.1 homoprotocatechuate degradation oper
MQQKTAGSHTQLPSEPSSDETTQPQRARRSLAISLLRAREGVMSHFRPILAAHDVTEQQWRVIRVLYEADKLDASEVADKASILAPSLTRMIRSLEERGFITKHRDDDDGRRVLLQITSAGQAIVEEVMPESLKVYADIDRRFGAERMERLLDMLEELTALRLEEAPDT